MRKLQLLSKMEVAAIVGLHPVSIMRLVGEGKFPRPIKPSATPHSRCRWDAADVDRWLRDCKKDAAA